MLLGLPFWDKVSSGLPLVSLWEQNVVLELKFQPIEKVLFELTGIHLQHSMIYRMPQCQFLVAA